MKIAIKYLIKIFQQEEPHSLYENKMELKGVIDCEKTVLYPEVGNYVKGLRFNQALDFEFFKPSDNLIILIMNNKSDIVYKEVTNTCETFHVIIETGNWPTGSYLISMSSMEGISVFGVFEIT